MNEISTSIVQYLVLVYAMIIGVSIGFYLIFLKNLQKYLMLKTKNDNWSKMRDGAVKIILAFTSIYIVFIMPFELLRHYITNIDYIKKLYDLYFYGIICSSFASILILIKIGKLRIKRKP